MSNSPKETDTKPPIRELRAFRALFWILEPPLILGFVTDPFSARGLKFLVVALMAWKLFYAPSISSQSSIGKISAHPKAWVFIAVCTMMVPFIVGVERVPEFLLLALVGFFVSALAVIIVMALTAPEDTSNR